MLGLGAGQLEEPGARQVRRRVVSICNPQVEGWTETADNSLTEEEIAKQKAIAKAKAGAAKGKK